MRILLSSPVARMTCWYLTFVLSGMVFLPGAVQAAFIPSAPAEMTGMSGDLLAEARNALEDQLLAEKLTALGLSPEEVQARLDSLTVEERQAVVADLENIQAGGSLVGLAVLVLLVILILKLMDKI
ncbi:MAG: PA2779 family protein [bacterium]|nr:PA2779 family protein [bacterium]MDT8367252.1 PA2779 family protein [bacterium]